MYIYFSHHTVPLGSIPELPAESCMEITSSEEEKTVSGIYWLNIKELGIIQVTFSLTSSETILINFLKRTSTVNIYIFQNTHQERLFKSCKGLFLKTK